MKHSDISVLPLAPRLGIPTGGARPALDGIMVSTFSYLNSTSFKKVSSFLGFPNQFVGFVLVKGEIGHTEEHP